MRIILIGQAAFADKTLDKLIGKGEEVVAVYCPPDPPNSKLDPVKQKAIQLGIPVRQHKSLKAPEVREEFLALNADLAILAFVTQIVPQQVFGVPKLGSICFHPSLLPKYRGASAINWALIRGESVTGLSLFWVDPGIDTGPVLLQKEVKVDPDDTTGSLYFNKIFPLGIEAIGEAVDLIKAGNPPRIRFTVSVPPFNAMLTSSAPISVICPAGALLELGDKRASKIRTAFPWCDA